VAKGAERWLWAAWADGLVMEEEADVIFLFFSFKFCVTCLGSFRQHKLGKLISNAFLRSRVGKGINFVKIIILRWTSQKSLSTRSAEMHMNLLAPVWAVN